MSDPILSLEQLNENHKTTLMQAERVIQMMMKHCLHKSPFWSTKCD